jgi:hypothetical protein
VIEVIPFKKGDRVRYGTGRGTTVGVVEEIYTRSETKIGIRMPGGGLTYRRPDKITHEPDPSDGTGKATG